jgi:hypothetical protein
VDYFIIGVGVFMVVFWAVVLLAAYIGRDK